jgi:hypothetical protein
LLAHTRSRLQLGQALLGERYQGVDVGHRIGARRVAESERRERNEGPPVPIEP